MIEATLGGFKFLDGTTQTTAATGSGSGSGSGDITGVTAGTGLSGGGATGDVTLNVDTTVIQKRVSGSCAAGSSIRVSMPTAPDAKLEVAGQVKITGGTPGIGKVLTSDANGLATWQLPATGGGGSGGGWVDDGTVVRLDTSTDKVGIGTTTPSEQLEITGNFSLPLTTGTTGIIKSGGVPFIHNFGANNFFAGENAGNLRMTGLGGNTASGVEAFHSNVSGQANTASGFRALRNNTSGGVNTASGVGALEENTTGDNNTAYGSAALVTNITGDNNTAIGSGADVSSPNLRNATAIGANAKVGAINSLVLGGTGVHGVNVGIGTETPSAKLEVVGQVKITGGSPGLNKVLTSDARVWQLGKLPP